RAHEWSIRPILLLLSLAVHIAGLLWGVAVWRMLLARVGVGVSFRALARIWFLSSLGRYVPGKIWQFVGAAHIGAVARIPPAVTVTSLAVHTGFFLIGAVITAALLLPADVLAGSGIPL